MRAAYPAHLILPLIQWDVLSTHQFFATSRDSCDPQPKTVNCSVTVSRENLAESRDCGVTMATARRRSHLYTVSAGFVIGVWL
jgi:hypothetical protein